MADFNFGKVGAALSAGLHANENMQLGPIDVGGRASFFNQDFTNFVANQDRIFTISGSSRDFIWGQEWGNSKTRVAK